MGVSLGITLTLQDFSRVRGLGAFTLPGIALWILAARYAGRRAPCVGRIASPVGAWALRPCKERGRGERGP